MRAPFLITFVTLILPLLRVHAQNGPEVKVNYFQNLPARLYSFDDTTNVAYHDIFNGDLFISNDEGKNWNRVEDIPQGETAMFIEHPFDNRMAFVLTRGTTHYRTEDRGHTWRSFQMPTRPSAVARPLSFHSDPAKYGYILYQGTKCERDGGWSSICHDETFYTKEAFSDQPQLLLSETSQCTFAHSSKDFKHDAHSDLIYCVAFDATSSTGYHSISSSRLFSSSDFFTDEQHLEDLGIPRGARGVVAFAVVSKFGVVALKDLSEGAGGQMLLYVTVNTFNWAKAQFPHTTSARLREKAYTIVESTKHSLAVDVVLDDSGVVGTLFVSNSNGTLFVQSLKDTNRNEMGYIDYEALYGIDGVGLANIVANAQDVERGTPKQLKTLITFDDGSSWFPLRPPAEDNEGHRISCNPSDTDNCALHLHSVTIPHNFGRIFSSPAPGFVMGVGSIGPTLREYEDSDTFLSTDAGVTWTMVRRDAHKYEFGDQGGIIVAVNDEIAVDFVIYSTDLGKTWKTLKLDVTIRARALTTVQDSTSQKFLLLGQLSREDSTPEGRIAAIFLDFAPMGRRKCGEADFEKWYARTMKNKECLMGHKQWYRRRKAGADCYVGDKFSDPVVHEENCPCQDDDYECDYNYVKHNHQCVPVGPEPIPAGVCKDPDQMYKGSSGYRMIPGNTCNRRKGVKKDKPVDKKCSQAQPEDGDVIHQTFEFPAPIVQNAYFKESTTILVRLQDGSIWQSSNEGYTWDRLFPDETFLAFYHHPFTPDRAYLITGSTKFYYTTDTGRSWYSLTAPNPPNTFGAQVLHFHSDRSDWIIWTGDVGCSGGGGGADCHAEAYYSRDNGRRWSLIEKYVHNCAWARDKGLRVDPSQILCESYRDKTGSQRFFQMATNPMQLVSGRDFFSKKAKLFDEIVGFTKFSEYLIVAEYLPQQRSLDLQVSLDGQTFAAGQFPPSMRPEQHAYTVLESSTDSVFLHLTTSEPPRPFWGDILKSNWNGTYFGSSIQNVNRDERGFVDFEKMIGLDGIAIVNVVSNPEAAAVTDMKELQTRITHNDGGRWKPLIPPKSDSHGRPYDCESAVCSLHVHGYTERSDPRATFSSPSVVGLIMAVGNVGEKLAPYMESDTFLSRDAGFTWEEVHKDAHLWEFGDSGSILVMANDEQPTDHVLYTTDEGLNWHEYTFTFEKIRVRSIVTVPSDTSRRFILLGSYARSPGSVAVHLDFTALTSLQCKLDIEDPGNDDFELWSPSEERADRCLFGRQTLYHRRRRDRNCVVGKQPKVKENIVKNCACTSSDFECEFNHERNANGECMLVEGTQPLPDDDSCRGGAEYWYERTPYRRIPHSSCEDGERPDRGRRHLCPGVSGHGFFFWAFVVMVPFAFTTLVAMWYYKRSGLATGTIRLPGDGRPRFGTSDAGIVETLASVPWYVIGVANVAFEVVAEWVRDATFSLRSRRGYRDVPVDEDAQILRFADEEE